MKLDSPDIPHKTEAGVIRIGVQTVDGARAAFVDIMERARSYSPTRGLMV